jgi:predicted site-specific integrase-resolvase
MIKNVIYSRVSSESERQDTERQKKELQEYAKTINYEVVEVLKKRQVDSKRTIKDQFFQK